jgi:penicillin-binding protein 2
MNRSGLELQRHIQLMILICVGVLIVRAAQLQIFDSKYREDADATTIHRMTAYPSRGLVFDRNGKLIVNNNAMYDLMVTYNQISPKMDTTKFCALLGISRQEFKENLRKNWSSGKFSKNVPFVFLKKIPVETYARLQESMYEFPGFFVQIRNIRSYPYAVGAHLLGYINEVDNRDITRDMTYASGDYIGATGIESEYETYLRGKKGANFQLKDNLGRIVGPFNNTESDTAATSGHDMISSIDIELQKYAEDLMQNKTGSVVAIEPSTGEILTMVSAPTYDPNLLMMTQTRGEIFSYLHGHPLKPFFDRTVMAKYPPGSIFKTVTTLVGLQSGTLNPNSGYVCRGGYFYGGRLYKCSHAHPPLGDVTDAIAISCNSYYFNEFRNAVDQFGYDNPQQGLDHFDKYARQLGLGVKLGIDYPNESPGNLPSAAYYDKLYPKDKGSWHSPTIMSMGIGQGELQLTTLQMANLAACIANRGYWIAPHLCKAFKDNTPIPEIYHKKNVTEIDRHNFELVVEGMAQCVIRGTARSCAIPDIQVCGKTGTSQNPHGEDHSVFFAFAPKDNPKIAIAVYVENAGWGSSYAAPIASLMIEKYMNGYIKPDRIPMQERMFKANLIDKFLANNPKFKPLAAGLPAPETPETPAPADTPEGAILNNKPASRPTDNKGRR